MRTKKSPAEISRTIQKTFIIAGIAAYLSMAAAIVRTYMTMPGMIESISMETPPIYLVDMLLFPLVLFIFAYSVFSQNTTKVSRLFKAVLVATVGVILSIASSAVFMEVFRTPLGYGATVALWTSPWLRLIPAVFALIFMVSITVFVLKKARDIEFTASKIAHKTLIAIIGIAFVANGIATSLSMSVDMSGNYSDGSMSFGYFIASAGIVVVPLLVLYLIASRKQTHTTRVFVATLYMLIAMFIFVVAGGITQLLSPSAYASDSNLNGVLLVAVALIVFVSIVAIQKLRKEF